jgi:outer membrane protein OmpA-like peptidoglycan-associated protein
MRISHAACIGLVGSLLAGCATPTGTSSTSAAEDAADANVAGLLTGGDSKFGAAMRGSSAVALQGGAVGYYMDRQEAQLREQLRGTPVVVVRRGDNVTLDMPGAVSFATGGANLDPQFHPVLDKVAATLHEYDKTVIEIAGHTDSVGSDANNQQLSEQRANSVAAYLASRGVQQARVVTIGAGKMYPVASNDTETGRASNRRVEITIVPVTQDSVKKAKKK